MMTRNKGLCTKQLHTRCTRRVFLSLYHLQSFYHLSYTVHSARLVELLDFPVEMVWNWLYFCMVFRQITEVKKLADTFKALVVLVLRKIFSRIFYTGYCNSPTCLFNAY